MTLIKEFNFLKQTVCGLTQINISKYKQNFKFKHQRKNELLNFGLSPIEKIFTIRPSSVVNVSWRPLIKNETLILEK
jgi:hypothetical protein